MLKVTVFPRLKLSPEQHANPYIQDFIQALNGLPDTCVVNPPHKNPLLSLLPRKHWGDVFIFNWFESLPEFKHGWLQSVIGACFVTLLRATGRQVVWVLHNRENHTGRCRRTTHFLRRFIAQMSTLVITHATDGVELVREQYPFALGKTHFLHHPTKDRLSLSHPVSDKGKNYDLLIWGHISRYKGVLDFARYLRDTSLPLRLCIAGRCADPGLLKELTALTGGNITHLNRSLSFEELGTYIARSSFVLTPYSAASVLSSGALMDSLSFGARVIGPAVGSFSDYAAEPRLAVHTFRSFDDIPRIVEQFRDAPVDREGYSAFLHENSWPCFANRLQRLIHS